MKIILLSLTILFAYVSFGQVLPDTSWNKIEPVIEKVMKDFRVPGMAIAVVQKDKTIYSKGFGYRDIEKKLPVTLNTLFSLASCTKTFTATLIGQLQKENKIDLDQPAHKYLESLVFPSEEMNSGITVRDMLSHRTGIFRSDRSWALFDDEPRDSIIKRIKYLETVFTTRNKFHYSNFMYVALGAIVEKITSKTYAENLRQRIFLPLDMKTSTTFIADLLSNGDAAVGYRVTSDSVVTRLKYFDPNAVDPAMGIFSSVNEMSNWLIAWINGGRFKGKEVVPTRFFTEALSSQTIVQPGLPTTDKPDINFLTYGLGWGLSSYRGHYRAEHNGRIDGFSAQICFYPTDSIGIIVLTNQNSSPAPLAVCNILSDHLLGKAPYDWLTDAKLNEERLRASQRQNARKSVGLEKPAMPLVNYTGKYFHPGYGMVTIEFKKDSLFAKLGSHTLWLKNDANDVFEMFLRYDGETMDTSTRRVGRYFVQFQLTEKRIISGLTVDLEPNMKPILFVKLAGKLND